MGLVKDDDIEEYLNRLIQRLNYQMAKKQLKKSTEKEGQKQKILKIIDLQKKVKELQEVQTEKNIVNIERELREGLQKYDINENPLEQDIEAHKEWNKYKTQNKQKKVQQTEKMLDELNKLNQNQKQDSNNMKLKQTQQIKKNTSIN